MDRAVVRFHADWKARYLVRVDGASPPQAYVYFNRERIEARNALSISEGHGYGMLATVVMAGADPGAQDDFDALTRFFDAHRSSVDPRMMAWKQVRAPNGDIVDSRREGDDSATDGDLDIGLALLMADRQWGSAGAIDYRAKALSVLAGLAESVVDPDDGHLRLGDWVENSKRYRGGTRSSDFMTAHLRVFAAADPAHAETWATARARTIWIVLDQFATPQSRDTGLMPDFFLADANGRYRPAPRNYLEDKTDGDYGYNACRDPWRLSIDRLMTGDTALDPVLAKLNAFIRAATDDRPARIRAGYAVSSDRPGAPLVRYGDLAFEAPFAVSAMLGAENRRWLDALWTRLAATPIGDGDYYGNSLKLMSMIVISGNWWEP